MKVRVQEDLRYLYLLARDISSLRDIITGTVFYDNNVYNTNILYGIIGLYHDLR